MESKSIKRFKSDLVKTMPFFPNNRETKEELLSQSMVSIIFHYLHWAFRSVPQRSRTVSIDKYVINDKRWPALKSKIENFASKVINGDSLTPYLSSKVYTRGYTSANRVINGKVDRWDDKDQLLNIMGFHHFHLGNSINPQSNRTNEVVFAKVTRTEFHIIAISNHSVFGSDTDNKEMTVERTRLWKIFNEFSSRGLPQGSVYVPTITTMSGHPLHIHDMTSEYVNVLNQIDPKLEQDEFKMSIYEETQLPRPKNDKLIWYINGLDLGLLDKNNQFFILRHGYM